MLIDDAIKSFFLSTHTNLCWFCHNRDFGSIFFYCDFRKQILICNTRSTYNNIKTTINTQSEHAFVDGSCVAEEKFFGAIFATINMSFLFFLILLFAHSFVFLNKIASFSLILLMFVLFYSFFIYNVCFCPTNIDQVSTH